MKFRVCKYNENVFGLRVAHIDFYLEEGGYVACPFTKGEVSFAEELANEISNSAALRAENEQLKAKLDDAVLRLITPELEAVKKELNQAVYMQDKVRAERDKAEADLTEARAAFKKVTARISEQDDLFALQHKRTREADKRYQEANKVDYFPDLGELVEWLMKQADDANADLATTREALAAASAKIEFLSRWRKDEGMDK